MAIWQIAFETSARQGSVALLREDVPVLQIVLDRQTRTAQSIAPATESLLDRLRQERAKLELVSVAVGPGSFTGLRIGVTAAKTLAFARGCPVISCDTLEVVINQVRQALSSDPLLSSRLFLSQTQPQDTSGARATAAPEAVAPEAIAAAEIDAAEIDAAIDAYRGQVFHRREPWNQPPLDQPPPSGSKFGVSRASDTADWSAAIEQDASQGKQIFVSGDVWQNRAARQAPAPNIVLTPAACWHPQAEAVGRLAWRKFQHGLAEDCFTLKPKYLRESAAVEKRAGR